MSCFLVFFDSQCRHLDLHILFGQGQTIINQSINQSCICTVVQVIKSLQDPLEVGNNLPGINSMQGSSFSHSGSTSHPPVRVSRWCKDSCDRAGVISAGLLQLATVRHLFIQPQQTTACTERPSAFRHDDQKMRSHHTGVGPSSLAPCYCPHSVQNRTADIQDTHRVKFTTYSSHTARHDNSGPPVTTCLKFRGWEPVSLNAASPTVLHTHHSGTVYRTSSLATWGPIYKYLTIYRKIIISLS